MKLKIKSTNDIVEFSIWEFVKQNVFFLGTEPKLFRSTRYGISFPRFADYWIELGRRNVLIEILGNKTKNKIRGFSFEEMLQKVSVLEFGTGTGVILYNVNMVTLGRMMDRFEGVQASMFNEDFVFIPTMSREQSKKLVDKIPPILAEAIALDAGLKFYDNYLEIK